MLKIVSVEHMRRIEAAADASGLTYAMLMENAGQAIAKRVRDILADNQMACVTILVGKGNNGGDGLVAARILSEESSLDVGCYLLEKRDGDPLLEAARTAGARIVNADDDLSSDLLREMISNSDLIVDALFGIGIRLPLRDKAVALLKIVEQTLLTMRQNRPAARVICPTMPGYKVHQARFPYVLAVDCPSGLDCDSGQLDDHSLAANETITFIAAKPGLLSFPGAGVVGQLMVATLGVPETLPELMSENMILADAERAHDWLPARPANSHKGTYGKALIIGGSPLYRGAVGLASEAAYRVGAGLVSVGTGDEVIDALAGQLREVTWRLHLDEMSSTDLQTALMEYSAILVGPGWSQMSPAPELLNSLIDAHSNDLPPVVIDADGLNLLAKKPHWWRSLPPNTVITPHPGEMARLANLTTVEVQANRWQLALEKAAEWQVVLVFKGAHTLIANPEGRVTALPFKTDALAKAGTGDVLAGIIVGLLAQGLEPYRAAVVGGYLHGLAGELSAQQVGTTRSVLAGDVISQLPSALMRVENPLFVEI